MNAPQELLPPEEKMLAVYSPFRAKVAEIIEENASMVFDYASPDGEKSARSHIHKLRLSKRPIDEARKAEKAESLAYGQRVDAEGQALIAAVDAMIEQHMKPIREKEEREKQRIEDIRGQIEFIESITANSSMSPEAIQDEMRKLNAVIVDESFAEFQAEAKKLQDERGFLLADALNAAHKRIADEAELAKLRAESEARAKKDREEQIAREAAEREKLEAETRAQREREQAEEREADAKARIARAEREADEAKAAAAKAIADAEARAKREAEERVEREAIEETKRKADLAHLATVNNEALKALVTHCFLSEASAKNVVTAIARGHIMHVRITY